MTSVSTRTEHVYNAWGYLSKILEADTEGGQDELSVIVAMDARGNITQERLANGYTTTRTFDPETGRLTHITTDLLGIGLDNIQDLQYDYDPLGNLLQRNDQSLLSQSATSYRNLQEIFSYDNLNRLTSSEVKKDGASQGIKNLTYDGLGNIKSKDGISYSYAQNSAGPHAVTTAGSTTYQYDANGNNTSGDGRSITYSTFDLPTHLAKGTSTVDFHYGADRNRTKRIDQSGGQTTTTLYLGNVEKITANNGSYQIKRYLAGGGLWIGSYSSTGQLTDTTRQALVKDHLGSVHTVLSSNSGQVQNQLMSFDAWGQRRDSAWTSYLTSLVTTDTTTRGFTGHEMVDSMGIIHMNGRIYDAKLGRFLQADPIIQAPGNTQSYNRYSYVLNNPTAYTDPSGFNFFKEVFDDFLGMSPETAQIVTALVSLYVCAGPWCLAAGNFAGTFATASAYGASFNEALSAGIISGVSTAAFYSIGINIPVFDSGNNVMWSNLGKNALAHAFTGGIMEELQGGKFGHGFAAAGFGAAFKPLNFGVVGFNTDMPSRITRTVIAATIGGTAARLSGGKFGNGASTAAFAHILNAESSLKGGARGRQKGNSFKEFLSDAKQFGNDLVSSAKENIKFGTTAKAVVGSGIGTSSIFTVDGISKGDTTITLDYARGAIMQGGVFVRGDVYSSGQIKGFYQSGEICAIGCIRGAWDYQGNFNIGTRLVFPISFGGYIGGGYVTSGEQLLDNVKGH